jgi:hypothetical protein
MAGWPATSPSEQAITGRTTPPAFDIDEEVLPAGVRLLEQIIRARPAWPRC